MGTSVAFKGYNHGSQTGINYGQITNEFHLPPDIDDKLPIVHEAIFDSYEDQYEEECLPGTRADVLNQIREWVFSPQGRCIFWLNGMAGTGKSAIARTLAKFLSQPDVGLLGASFFFKRGEGDRGSAMKLFPTLIRQLGKRLPELMPGVQMAAQDNPDIAKKGLKEQFDKIVLQPLLGFDSSLPKLVIVIDALDECDVDNDIRLVLQLLPQLQKSKSVCLRVFITSRPELLIRQEFSKIANHDCEELALHGISETVIEKDISLFLKHRLSKIKEDHSMPDGFPGDSDIQNLVTLSTPLFISAATVCRILGDPMWDPMESLSEILAHGHNDGSQFSGTYLPVLNRLLKGQSKKQEKQLVQDFQEVVGAVVMLKDSFSVVSLSRFLGIAQRLVSLRLNPLHSVLRIPEDCTEPVRLFHLSFRDFLLDPETRHDTPFWVDEKDTHYKLAKRCLKICDSLKKNVCKLKQNTERTEIDHQTIHGGLPPELRYSCRYWAHHLTESEDPVSELEHVSSFIHKHFLHWMEAMSILGLVSEIVGIITLLQAVICGDKKNDLNEFLHDAKRFVLKNRKIANDTPLQIYYSGLAFAPKNSLVRRRFSEELPHRFNILSQLQENWSSELQSLEGHSASVESVAFSPDGRLLASGSFDYTVRIWDATTGALQQTLEGHSDRVTSVAFSHTGKVLASGSHDMTIRLWDSATGALHQVLTGHSGWVESVAFSHNQDILISGSYDKTVRLWDTAMGDLKQTLEGHSDRVTSVAFSSNDLLLASASFDKTVQIFDPAGNLQHTLRGHSDRVTSVAFRYDNRVLASGSYDKTIRLWDATKGTLQQVLEGHSGSIESVSFSLYDDLLASGSYDNTVRLWNTATGSLEQTFVGHLSWILSVAFSRDSRIIASGSHDKTVRIWDHTSSVSDQKIGRPSSISSLVFSHKGHLLTSDSDDNLVRLWDATTGNLKRTLEGHSAWVLFVAFSFDDQLLASCSLDTTIKLWDTTTGTLRHTLSGHSGPVEIIAFSCDDHLLASGSFDTTVRLWDTVTGTIKHTLRGHSGWVLSVAFSFNGRLLASGSNDNTIRLWDSAKGSIERVLQGHTESVRYVQFAPNGQILASGSDDQTIMLWNTTTGTLWRTLQGHSASVRSLAFSPDGRTLASSSDDKTVKFWDIATAALQKGFDVARIAFDLEFSEDNSVLKTSLGYISLSSSAYKQNHESPDASGSDPCRFLIEGEWVTLFEEKMIWLPPEYRAHCTAVRGNTLALANEAGLCSIIEFRE